MRVCSVLYWLNVLQHSSPNPYVCILCFMAIYFHKLPPPPSRPQFWYHVGEKRVYMADTPLSEFSSDTYAEYFLEFVGLHRSGTSSALRAFGDERLRRAGVKGTASLSTKIDAIVSYLAEDGVTIAAGFDEQDRRYYPARSSEH